MARDDVQAWLDKYVEAWRTYDVEKISELFSEDALYLYNPFDEDDPVRGRAAIVADWLEKTDDPDSWRARYVPIAVDGSVAVAQGRTQYFQKDGSLKREFDNIFVIHFDGEGRCSLFTEWYFQRPDSARDG
jgi:ketosteroid isomerase-like protein